MALIQKNVNWKPYEVIYSAGDEPDGLYLIKEGIVELYTPEGLKLNEISDNEIFGESSIILETKRTVTAKTGKFNVFASFIPKKNFLQLIEKNTALSAIIKKTQLRLIDSNHQSQELTNEIEKLASLPSMETLRAMILGLLNSSQSKIVFALQSQQSNVVRLINANFKNN